MLHHHPNEETQMVDIASSDHTPRRHHPHLTAAVVIDHIKKKVKRKQTADNISIDNPILENNNIIKEIVQDQHESEPKLSLTTNRSSPINSSPRSSDIYIDANSEKIMNEEHHSSTGSDENDTTNSRQIDKNKDNNGEVVQRRIDDIEQDIDSNKKNTKIKSKSSKKVSKPRSDSIGKSSMKKRRHTTRSATESSPKTRRKKKNNKKTFGNMESATHVPGFQIRDEDFNSIFNDLPSDEQLIIAYPCAWRKDMFMHGRMFLSANYLCFYTSFLKWEESICIAFKDIVSVTKEKSAKVLPNAIKIQTNNREQYIFACYIPRERIFTTINRLWQNASLEKPLDYKQLRATMDADQMSNDESSEDSEESVGVENNDLQSSEYNHNSQSLPLLPSGEPLTTSTLLNTEIVTPSENKEKITYLSTCPCETHLARTYVDRLFYYPVDMLLDLTYGDNSFTRDFHESQKLIDYNSTEWRLNNETGKRERQVTYKTVTQSILGTNTISCTEKQTIDVAKPHSLYIVNSEVYNEGMKYTDAFYVATRFCMFQRDTKHSSLRVSAEIKYVKNVNAIAKAFIDKNATSSIEDGLKNQMRKLENQQALLSNSKSGQKKSLTSKQHIQEKKDNDTSPDERKDDLSSNSPQSYKDQSLINKNFNIEKSTSFNIILFFGIFFLSIHIYLCYKLYFIDRALNIPDFQCLNQCRKDCLEKLFHS